VVDYLEGSHKELMTTIGVGDLLVSDVEGWGNVTATNNRLEKASTISLNTTTLTWNWRRKIKRLISTAAVSLQGFRSIINHQKTH
jgi:hypothetical protein